MSLTLRLHFLEICCWRCNVLSLCNNKGTHASDLYSGARDVDQKENELFLSSGSDIPAAVIANIGAVPL